MNWSLRYQWTLLCRHEMQIHVRLHVHLRLYKADSGNFNLLDLSLFEYPRIYIPWPTPEIVLLGLSGRGEIVHPQETLDYMDVVRNPGTMAKMVIMIYYGREFTHNCYLIIVQDSAAFRESSMIFCSIYTE